MCIANNRVEGSSDCYHAQNYLSEEADEAHGGEQEHIPLSTISRPGKNGSPHHEECNYEVEYSVRELDQLRRIV